MKQKVLAKAFYDSKSYGLPLLLSLLIVCLNLFNPQAFGQVANVNTPTGGFNIDGTLKANTAIGDWTPGTGSGGYVLQNNAGTWAPVDASKTTFIRDGYGTNPDLIFNGGQFGDNPNTKWTWKPANSLNKCDIGTVLIHSTTSATSKWLILGGDRLAQTGTSYIDFEFSQGLFTRLANGTFSSLSAPSVAFPNGASLSATGGRTVGDFVLSMEYTNGGAVATVHYYRWEQAGTAYKFVEKPIPEPGGVASAFGRSNTVATEVLFGAFGNTSYPPYAFAEAAVNIDAIFAASCQSVTIRSVFVKTKSSDAYNADLKDFVDPQPVNFVFGSAGLDYGATSFCQTGSLTPTVPNPPTGTFTASPSSGLSINATTGAINLGTSNTGTYTITYTPSGGNCIVPATATITINPLPGPPTVTVVNNCDGSSDLTASNYTGTLLWSNGATSPSIRVTNAATYTVTQTSATGCTSTTGSGVSAPRSTPTAGAGADITVNCTTPGATLTATGGTAYLWSTGATTASTTVTPSTTTSYSVTVTGANGCTATDAVTVTVDKATPTAAAGDDVTVTCTTPSAILTATGGASYLWSTGATTASTTVTPPTTATYTVTVTGANGCTATDAVTVTVDKATPAAAAGDDVTVTCTTPSATLTATGGISYQWSNGATTASTTVTPSTTTTYTVTVTGANGCTATDAVTVTVNKTTPTAGAGDDVTVTCTTPNATLTATGGTSYLWSTGATTASITVTPSTTTTYTVTVKGANGCTATDAVTVTVNKATPTAGAGNDVTVNCTTPSTTLTATGGTSYQWSTGATTASITVTPSSTTTYTVTVTGANGCTSTDAVTVTVNKNAPPTPTICVVEPSLCGATTGSVTILSPLDEGANDYEYRMNGGAWQDGTSFTNLAPGSLSGNATGFEVRLKSSGCISLPAKSCASPCGVAKLNSETVSKTTEVKDEQTKIDNAPAEAMNTTSAMETITAVIPSKATALAFPNPFSDNIRFTLQSPISGKAALDLYNMMGQKVKTVFEGYVQAGKSRNIEYNVPASQRTNLTWVFTVGDQKVSGKLIGIK